MKTRFVDSNIIIYANDGNAGVKQDQAISVVQYLMRSQSGVISTQVMQEYAHVALAKLNQPVAAVLRQLRLLENLSLVPLTGKTTRRAVEIQTTYHISFWDANIIAAAEEGNCDAILSEDLNAGQLYAGINVSNPFAPDFQINSGEADESARLENSD